MNFHHTYSRTERNTAVSEILNSRKRIDLRLSNRFPKSLEEDEDLSFPCTTTSREFERISLSPLSDETKGRLHHRLPNLRSSFLHSNALSECSGRSHLSEPEPIFDDDMMHEMLEFVAKKL